MICDTAKDYAQVCAGFLRPHGVQKFADRYLPHVGVYLEELGDPQTGICISRVAGTTDRANRKSRRR